MGTSVLDPFHCTPFVAAPQRLRYPHSPSPDRYPTSTSSCHRGPCEQLAPFARTDAAPLRPSALFIYRMVMTPPGITVMLAFNYFFSTQHPTWHTVGLIKYMFLSLTPPSPTPYIETPRETGQSIEQRPFKRKFFDERIQSHTRGKIGCWPRSQLPPALG